MNLYAHDLSLLDFNLNFSDSIIDPFARHNTSSSSSAIYFHDDDDDHSVGRNNYGNQFKSAVANRSPPKHRHDGTSPLPLGMDWSTPPRKWDGRDSEWPHDPHTGWSYCVTVPSWMFLPRSRGSDPVVFFRVQVAVQSPAGITTSRGILRRFNEFLKLSSELKEAFPKKKLPPAPSKRILRMKSRTLLEDRRTSLEDWMEKLLSDIDVSRSAPVAIFLELEAAARSSFNNVDHQTSDEVSSISGNVLSFLPQTSSGVSFVATTASMPSDEGSDAPYEVSDLGTPRHGDDSSADLGFEKSTDEQVVIDPMGVTIKNAVFSRNFFRESLEKFSRHKVQAAKDSSSVERDKISENASTYEYFRMDGTEYFAEIEDFNLDAPAQRLAAESLDGDLSSVRNSKISNLEVRNLSGDVSEENPEGSGAPRSMDSFLNTDLQFPRELLLAFPVDERLKMNRVLGTIQQRLTTARTDMEDLIARLNQEVAVRQFLTTKVKDLEVELQLIKQNSKENMQQAVLTEKDKFMQMQWDMEEARRKCLEMEVKLESERDEKVHAESAKLSILEENNILRQELEAATEQLEILRNNHEEFEQKSKADVKLLVKEVKSLRSSQSELKRELSQLMKEKIEVERVFQKEKQKMEQTNISNLKLLHECAILYNRLQECSVNFLVEEEDKLIVETSSPSDAIDLLATSDNRIGLLLAEAQLLVQDVENGDVVPDTADSNFIHQKADNSMRKMLTDVFVDNAKLRMQINSVMRCALNVNVQSEKDLEEEVAPVRKTVLSKFLER